MVDLWRRYERRRPITGGGAWPWNRPRRWLAHLGGALLLFPLFETQPDERPKRFGLARDCDLCPSEVLNAGDDILPRSDREHPRLTPVWHRKRT